MARIKRALLSLSDKSGVVELAKTLDSFGCEIISTGGTARLLKGENIPVTEVSDYTGSPEILDGRLKTLHPKVHGGLLGVRSNPRHISEMEKEQIKPIDMVVVNLYPFEETVEKGGSFEDAIENIDIGGPAMLRAAAKNFQDVTVVVDPADYPEIIKELKENGGVVSLETNFRLAKKVFSLTSSYDVAISNYLGTFERLKETRRARGSLSLPEGIGFTFVKVMDLRYGENPHQKAAFYRDRKVVEPCVASLRQLHGKELSYNNIMDTDAVIELIKEFDNEIVVAIVKHANPCGVAISAKSPAEAFKEAKDCDPVSAFGGIVGLNRPVDEETAKAISETFFEVIAAPSFNNKALEILRAKKNIRLLEIPGLDKPYAGGSGLSLRKVVGGLLVQDRDQIRTEIRAAKVVTKRRPTDKEYKALEFAWKVVKHVKSNAIVFTDETRTLGVGAGQMSRVDSVKVAAIKMKDLLDRRTIEPSHRTIALASDAFFPFRDGVDLAAEAGAASIIQPGGSIRDDEVIKAADEHGIAMIFTGTRHFRH